MIESSPSTGDHRRRRFSWNYRAGWSVCASTLIAVGLACALATGSWPTLIAAILTVAFFVVVIGATALPNEGLRAMANLTWRGLLVGTVLAAATGLTVVLGTLGLLLVVLLSGTAPGLPAGVRRGWKSVTQHRDAEAVDQQAERPGRVVQEVVSEPTLLDRTPWLPEALDSLDDVSLCLAWRSSFLLLEAAASVEDRVAIIEHRQRYLDELQRRNPQGVAAWLSSGARASGNPLPYLEDRPHD